MIYGGKKGELRFTDKDLEELCFLQDLQKVKNRCFMGHELSRLRYLNSKMRHNTCLNPQCSSNYVATNEQQENCPYCEQPIYKMVETSSGACAYFTPDWAKGCANTCLNCGKEKWEHNTT